MKKIYTIILALFPFVFSSLAFAQSDPPRFEQIGNILDSVFKYVMPLGGLVATIMIIYGGYMWMIAGGDAGKTQQAQGTLTWSILGLVFLFLIQMILKLIFDFLAS